MFLIVALSLIAAVTVGYRCPVGQVQRMALYLIIMGCATYMILVASTWAYLG